VANKIDGVVQSPPVSSTCIPMDASNHTFEFQIVSDEVFTSGPLVGQPRPIVEGTYSWTHSDGFNLLFSNSTGTLANFSTFTNSDCPRGYAGSVSASITTNCPAPLTKHSANFPIGRSFTDQVIITDPDAAQLCIDDLGERYDFFINNISCGANIAWTPPPLGWYAHSPMAEPQVSPPGASWSGHVAVPSAINGLSQVLTASDGCGHTLTSNPLVVSWTDLDVLLELIPFASGYTKCPEFTAQLVNLPEGCCSDMFEFIWTHSHGDEAFCERRNPSGCGQNRISVLEPGLISLTVKSCAENPCKTCVRSDRYTWLIRDNSESSEWFAKCREGDAHCPKITRQCEPLVVLGEETHSSNKNARSAVAPEKPNEIGLQVVPNPAGKSFTIQLDQPVENAEYQLQDLYGKSVLSGKISGSTSQVRVSKLSRGTYILKVSTEKGIYSKSVILE
jgi:hypothetical protein